MLNLISFAIFEKRYLEVVNLIGKYLNSEEKLQPERIKKMYIDRAEAFLNLGKNKECLDDCEEAQSLGVSLMEVYHLKTKAFLERGEVNVNIF